MPVHGFGEGKNKEEVYPKSAVYNKNEVYNKDEVDTSLSNKVDKVEGKELSTNDYTNDDKAEVDKVQNKQDKHSTANITLLAANWSNKSQTVNVTGVTASNTVLVSPAPTSIEDYGACNVICTTQGAGTLTFVCNPTPANNLSVNVVILEV